MTVLALDTAGETLSVALRNKDGCRYFEIDESLRHSERLMEIVDMVIASAGLLPEHLDLVACMGGPGSFTGLRIAYSAAKGMALALDIPLIAVPTLDCLAFSYSHWPGIVLPTIDAKKGSFFSAAFHEGVRLTEDAIASVEELAVLAGTEPRVLLTGSGAPGAAGALRSIILPEQIHIDPAHRSGRARELSTLAILRFRRNGRGEVDEAGPNYLRKSDAELVKEAGHG